MKKKNYKSLIIAISSIFIIAAIVYIFMPSRAADGNNDYKIDENGNLEYYIDVMYDGTDETATTSSSSATASVFSDYIYVEDKLPEGVTYAGQISPSGVANWDCTYGAVEQGDSTKSCSGYVVGAAKENNQCVGVNYDSSTRIVSFAVKELKAGCKLTVGIKGTTDSLNGSDRIDLYNTAYAWEEKFTAKSNQVHVFMGNLNAPTFYTVSYSYSENISGFTADEMPKISDAETHIPGVSVGLAREPVLEGYEFSGWSATGITVTNGKFTMPSADVTFTGRFTKKTEYTVTYTTSETSAKTGYVAPTVKTYGVGDNVSIEVVNEDNLMDGYTFDGWTTEDVTGLPASFKSGSFKMPSKNVTINGVFSEQRYNLSYQYKGVVPNDAVLPATTTHVAGEQVTLVQPSLIPQNYRFLGWYSENTFTMPNEDVVIYGEWAPILPTFTPSITITQEDSRTVFANDEEIEFSVVIANNESYPITDTVVKSNLEGCLFNVTGTDQKVSTIEIPSIPANGSVTLTEVFTPPAYDGENLIKAYTNKAIIINSVGDSSHEFYTDNEVSATYGFSISNLSIVINTVDSDNHTLNGAKYQIYTDQELENPVSDEPGTEFNGLGVGTYYLKQTYVTAGYMAVAGPITLEIDSSGVVTITGYTTSLSADGTITTIDIPNAAMDILPYTGGIGNLPFIIGGLIAIVVSCICCIVYVKKKNKKSEKKGGDLNEK